MAEPSRGDAAASARTSGADGVIRSACAHAPVATRSVGKEPQGKTLLRADKDKNGRIEREELLASRRKAFAKLDKDGNGTLAFDEWAVKTINKFAGADKDRSGWLNATEYATTAPPPPKKKRCSC